MNPICPPIQERLLADPKSATAQAHLLGCEHCSAWWIRTERLIGAIGDLESLSAPSELDELVVDELAVQAVAENSELSASELSADEALTGEKFAGEKLFERELRRLSRLPVPAMLDDLVLEPRKEDRSPALGSVAGLFRHTAPPVLDRLVAEELAEPARHRVERFAGDLERPVVPTALDTSIPGALGEMVIPVRAKHSRTGNVVRRMLGPIVTLAAGVMLWTSLDSSFSINHRKSPTPEYRFTVVRATSIDQLSPLTQSFLRGMTQGGVPGSIPGTNPGTSAGEGGSPR